MEQQKIKLFENRDLGKNFETTFAFLKQNYLQILKSISIFIPIMLIAVYFTPASASISPEDIAEYDNPFDVYRSLLTWKLFLTYFLIYGSLLIVGIFTVCYVAVYSKSEDGVVNTSEVWSKVFSSILPIIGASILVGILCSIGFILCIIPGIMVAVYLSLYMYTYVVEEPGVVESLQRSYELVKDYWWQTFGFTFLIGIVAGAINFAFSLPALMVTFGQMMGSEFFAGDMYIYIANFISYIGNLLIYPITYVGLGILYFSYRNRMEGVDMETEIDRIGSENQNFKY